jgi:hypothetical protein
MSNINTSEHGIILIFFKIKHLSSISEEVFEDWLNEEYVPALASTAGIETAWLYTAANPDYDKQQVVVCRASELSVVRVERLVDLTKNGEPLLLSQSFDDLIEPDLRIYSFVQLFETSTHTEGQP